MLRPPVLLALSSLGALFALAAPLRAQTGSVTQRVVARAASLLANGEVARAESLYYVAARRSTGDPAARLALGRYLIARGAFRIGSTLLDEAIAFGGDTAAVARLRAPALEAAGNWIGLAHLA